MATEKEKIKTEYNAVKAYFKKDAFNSLDYMGKIHAAITAAAYVLSNNIQTYDPASVCVEPQSMYPDDWYLWTVWADGRKGSGKEGTKAVWTMNLTGDIIGFSGGYYDIKTIRELTEILKKKRYE